MLNNAPFHSQNYVALADALWAAPCIEMAVCVSSAPWTHCSHSHPPSEMRWGSETACSHKKPSIAPLELRPLSQVHSFNSLSALAATTLSKHAHWVGLHPQCDLGAKPRHSNRSPLSLGDPSIGKQIFVNKSCQGLPMKTSQVRLHGVAACPLSAKLVEQKPS